MFNIWKTFRQNNNQPVASFSKYYHIFVSKFNISFGHPRQDVCSFCTEMKKIIMEKLTQIKKKKLNLNYKLTQKNLNYFFKKLLLSLIMLYLLHLTLNLVLQMCFTVVKYDCTILHLSLTLKVLKILILAIHTLG